jgi:hypothetical protein
MPSFLLRLGLAGCCAALFLASTLMPQARSGPVPVAYWNVDDLRPGMKGFGQSVFKGDRLEKFQAEVLGVLKSVSPGRDMVLMRLSGCDLEKTGVIAGMSGSPIYIDGKLVGAVAYAWSFGTEPIAGITPFSQMVEFVESYEQRDLATKGRKGHAAAPARIPLREALFIEGRRFTAASVADTAGTPGMVGSDELALRPLQCPLAASNFTAHALDLLMERTRWAGLVPMQAGAAPAHLRQAEKSPVLEPGAPLAVALVRGDFDLSGIGTVTHVEGERVYGWGHPFMGLGTCELPLMSGWIHTVYPRQTVSFKMGSPLQTLGVINADVSTGIAGWLGRKPDMMPITMTVRRDPGLNPRQFSCEIARNKALLPQLVYTTLTNSVDMEGDLPEELTAELEARVEIEGKPPLLLRDTFSGSAISGGRAPAALYAQVASLIHAATYNPFEPVRIKRIACDTTLTPGRITADIEAVELESDVYMPGETLRASVFLRPYKGPRQRVNVRLKLPADLAPGTYSALICDDPTNTRLALRESPVLWNPTNLDQHLQSLDLQTSVQRTSLVVRLPIGDTGVSLDGQTLPDLPGSMVEMLSSGRRTGAQTMAGALVSKHATDWVVQGSQSVKFTVVKHKPLGRAQ